LLASSDLRRPAYARAEDRDALATRYDDDADALDDFGYGLGLMIEPVRPGERFGGHAGSGPGSTITVFSALMARRTFAASVGPDAPDTFPELLEYLRTLV
jgi:hypothetical protein